MNILKLENLLIEANVPKHSYSLTGGFPGEAYCLEKISQGWQVYYHERGYDKLQCAVFEQEEDACIHLLSLLRKYVFPYYAINLSQIGPPAQPHNVGD